VKANSSRLILHEKNLYKTFITLGLPIFLSSTLTSLHDFISTYFIGNMENSVSAQAGIATAWPLQNMLLALGMGLSTSGIAILSQLTGAGNENAVKKYSSLLLVTSISLGAFLNLFLFTLGVPILKLMGAEGEVLAQGSAYLRVRCFELVPMFIFQSFQAMRYSRGDTKTPVLLSSSAVVINLILTAIFVRVMELGVVGAAFASVAAQTAIIVPAFLIMTSRKNELRISFSLIRTCELHDLKTLLRFAIPVTASNGLNQLGFVVLQAVILSYGAAVSAAFSIGNKLSTFTLLPSNALSSVVAAFIGQNIGAGNKERAIKGYKASRTAALIIGTTLAAIVLPFSRQILSLLTNDPTALEVAMDYAFWVCLTVPMMAFFQNYTGVFNGSGNTKLSLIMSTSRLWAVRLPLILAAKHLTNLGPSGIWYAMTISNLLMIGFGAFLMRWVDFEPKVRAAE